MTPSRFRRAYSGAVWETRNGYCRALRVASPGDPVFVTGTTAIEPDGSVHAPGDAGRQTACALAIIERALIELGAGRTDVVRVRIFTTDIGQADAIGAAHKAFFGGHHPCLTLVGIASLVDPAMVVEIEADAVVAPASPAPTNPTA